MPTGCLCTIPRPLQGWLTSSARWGAGAYGERLALTFHEAT